MAQTPGHWAPLDGSSGLCRPLTTCRRRGPQTPALAGRHYPELRPSLHSLSWRSSGGLSCLCRSHGAHCSSWGYWRGKREGFSTQEDKIATRHHCPQSPMEKCPGQQLPQPRPRQPPPSLGEARTHSGAEPASSSVWVRSPATCKRRTGIRGASCPAGPCPVSPTGHVGNQAPPWDLYTQNELSGVTA